MSLPRPFVTDIFTLYKGDISSRKLPLALWITDDYTGKNIASGVKVFLKGQQNKKPIINLSGYFCFADLDGGIVTVVVEPNHLTFGYYKRHEQEIDLDSLNALEPVINIALSPQSSYPYPAQATLIRGSVGKVETLNESTDAVIKGALIEASFIDTQNSNDKLLKTWTDHNGEFVLALKKLEFQDNKKNPAKKDLQIDISFATFRKTVLVEGERIKESQTLNLSRIQFP